MKRNFVLTVILLLALLATTVHAAVLQAETAPHIKVVIDGVLQDFKDANGNKVDPVIINGSTYLPLRPIAGAFGKELAWDANTSTVTIGASAGNVEVNLIDVFDASKNTWVSKVNGESSLTFPHIGDVGVKFQTAIKISDVNATVKQTGSYNLNGSYKTLSCTLLFVPDSLKRPDASYVVRMTNADTGVDIFNRQIKANELVQINGADITGLKKAEFSSKSVSSVADNGVVYILNPIVK